MDNKEAKVKLSEIDYEKEVRVFHPTACIVYFEHADLVWHVRLYGDGRGLPRSLGAANDEYDAWKSAYEHLHQLLLI